MLPKDDLVRSVEDVLSVIDQKINNLKASTNIACREGCGDCCNNPSVEAQVVEMLPLADAIIESGKADDIFDLATQSVGKPCIFYKSAPNDKTVGRCTVYDKRPSLCRLFGFAAVRDKNQKLQPVVCTWQKQLFPNEVEKFRNVCTRLIPGNDGDGESAFPVFSDFGTQIQSLAPGPPYNQRLHINEALSIAIEKQFHRRQAMFFLSQNEEEGEDDHNPDNSDPQKNGPKRPA